MVPRRTCGRRCRGRRGRGGQQSPRGCKGRLAVTSWEGRGQGPGRDRGRLQACGFGSRREQGSQAELGGEDRLDGWREDEVWGSPDLGRGSTRHRGHGGSPSRDLCLLTCEMGLSHEPPLPPCDSPPSLLPPGDPQLNSPAQGKALGSPRGWRAGARPRGGRTPRPPLAPGPPPCLLLPQLSRALSPELTEPLVLQADAVAWPAWTCRALHLRLPRAEPLLLCRPWLSRPINCHHSQLQGHWSPSVIRQREQLPARDPRGGAWAALGGRGGGGVCE